MRLIKLRENIWINADHITHLTHDPLKGLTRFHLLSVSDPITVSVPIDDVLRGLGFVDTPPAQQPKQS